MSDLGGLADPADIGRRCVIRTESVQRIAGFAPTHLAADHPVALGTRGAHQRSESKLFTEVIRSSPQQCYMGHEGPNTTDGIDVGIDQLEFGNTTVGRVDLNTRPEKLTIDESIDCADEFATQASELSLCRFDVGQGYVGQ